MVTRIVLVLAASIALTWGCGGDDDGGGGDAPDAASSTPDAAGGNTNALGVRCGPGNDCPAGNSCVVQPVPTGSTMQGYCAPACTEPSDCTDGYSGPGNVLCFGGPTPSCTISCSTEADCPTELACLSTGGPTFVCAVEEGSGGGGGGN